MMKGIRYINSTRYLSIYKKTKINEKMILLESQKGKNLNGNIFYLIKALLEDMRYSAFNIVVSVESDAKEKFERLCATYHLNPHFVVIGSRAYLKALSSAKFLITDTSFAPFFIKKDEQVFINVWHGTPLKTLGKKDHSSFHSLGNVQKNFFIADYLLYPNEYMMKHMIEDYMLENICDAECLIHGYPRNEAFFKEKNSDILHELNLSSQQIIGYMPTWRGTIGQINNDEENVHVMHYLYKIDKGLKDEQVMLVNLHPFVQNAIDFSNFKHILPFPTQFETYEVLNICDVLVTDYSSVFFDYANTRNKIILFMYDLEEYFENRGLYLPLDSLPFPIVNDVSSLIDEINQPKNYDENQFLEQFCSKDNHNASIQLLDAVIMHEENGIEHYPVSSNGKENVLIYAGNLAKNGITTALVNLINHLDVTKYNYYLTFSARRIAPHKQILKQFPEEVHYISMLGKLNASLIQKIILKGIRRVNLKHDYFEKMFDELYTYELKRCFGNIPFSNLIFYNGYEYKRQLMFGRFKGKKTIFVHSNMVEEVKRKNNQHPSSLRYAYNHYDHVAIVSEDMLEPTLTFCDHPEKIVVVNNLISYETVLEKAQHEIYFDKTTEINCEFDEMRRILDDSTAIKFINVGRYSVEKGHERLIEAFEQIWKEESKCYLFIIGGYGPLYESTIELAASKECSNHIILIKSMSNPYTIFKQCDYLVFTSFYEGFGLVLAEADILGLPVCSTDILGPRTFMEQHGGLLVDNSIEGIVDGMRKMLHKEVEPLNVDYEKYNQQALVQFESLLE